MIHLPVHSMTDNNHIGNYNWICAGVAKVLAARRLELKLSQEEIAQRSGLHRTYISDVERGSRNISLKSLARLAEAIELPPSTVLALAEESAGFQGEREGG